jgi:hypothetical protein
MPAGLQFVLILPDGSKSLVPAEWTDFNTPISPPPVIELLGSQQHLLCLRSLVDSLLRRAADAPITSGAAQESMPQLHLNFIDIPVPETRLWEQLDDEHKRIVIEILARLLVQTTRPQQQEPTDD